MEGLAWVFRALVSLHMFSVLGSSGCLQECGNPWGWAEHPRGGCGSLSGYQEEELQGAITLVFLSPASHYYKYKQQFIFPGESPVSKPADAWEWPGGTEASVDPSITPSSKRGSVGIARP